jgi:hypothetical protein
MTVFLFCMTLLTGFIAGFAACLAASHLALEESNAQVFRDACLNDRLILDTLSVAIESPKESG